MSRDCEHGQLARSCNICDLERELKAVTAQRDKLLAALEGVARELGIDWLREEFDTARDVIKEVKGQS